MYYYYVLQQCLFVLYALSRSGRIRLVLLGQYNFLCVQNLNRRHVTRRQKTPTYWSGIRQWQV